MSAGFTSPLIHSLGSSDGIGLPSNAAWLARFFGSLSHVQLSGNSPAKTLSAPKTTEQNAMRNDLLLVMCKSLAARSVADNCQFVGTRRIINLLQTALAPFSSYKDFAPAALEDSQWVSRATKIPHLRRCGLFL